MTVIDEYNKRANLKEMGNYLESLRGARVRWSGELRWVVSDGTTRIEIRSWSDRLYPTMYVDAQMNVAEATKARSIKRGTRATIEGTICGWEQPFEGDYFTVKLENGRLAP